MTTKEDAVINQSYQIRIILSIDRPARGLQETKITRIFSSQLSVSKWIDKHNETPRDHTNKNELESIEKVPGFLFEQPYRPTSSKKSFIQKGLNSLMSSIHREGQRCYGYSLLLLSKCYISSGPPQNVTITLLIVPPRNLLVIFQRPYKKQSIAYECIGLLVFLLVCMLTYGQLLFMFRQGVRYE